MAQTTLQPVLQRVADSLHVTVATLPPEWSSLAAQAVKDAAADLLTILAGKGYSSGQLAQVDQFAAWQERLAFVYTMERGTALASYSLDGVKELNPCEMIEKLAVVLIDGVPTAPDGTSQIAPVFSGQVRAAAEGLRGLGRHHDWPGGWCG